MSSLHFVLDLVSYFVSCLVVLLVVVGDGVGVLGRALHTPARYD